MRKHVQVCVCICVRTCVRTLRTVCVLCVRTIWVPTIRMMCTLCARTVLTVRTLCVRTIRIWALTLVLTCIQKHTSFFFSFEQFGRSRNVKCCRCLVWYVNGGGGLGFEVEGSIPFCVTFFVLNKMLCDLQLTKPTSPRPKFACTRFQVVRSRS